MDNTANFDPYATRESAKPPGNSGSGHTRTGNDSETGHSSGLEVRCPHCQAPTEVAADTSLTDLTCISCGSHFCLVDQSIATRMAPAVSRLGRFELIERLGVGSFGSVWKARDNELDRTVAIKIPRQAATSLEEQEQFFREARAAAQLRHPNIVTVHEVGRDGDSLYIVSDFVRGVTLHDWLTGQHLTSREAAELCAEIADALHHAHEQGVVHRDLKPANIMIDRDGQPHLMDFGLARREVGEVTVTTDGQILGTPAYMSPEQAQGEAHTADRRSDVYSLGVILFQLITGERPFRGNARMLLHQVINEDPPSPRKLNANIKRDLETITTKCLEKSPDRRYQSAFELAAELRRFLASEPIKARPIGRLQRTWRWSWRHPQVASLSALLLLVLTAATLVSTWQAVRATNAERQVMRERDQVMAEKQAKERALVAKQEALANAERKERIAQERLASGLLAAGDAALALGRADARDSYVEARHLCRQLGLSELPVVTGLLASYGDQPPPLMGDDGTHQGVGGFDDGSRGARRVVFTPDGGRAVSASARGTLTAWDVRTGLPFIRFPTKKIQFSQIAISPDGRTVLTACFDHTARLWDLTTGQQLRTLVGHEDSVRSVAFSADGQKAASTSVDITVRVWDLQSGKELNRFKPPSYPTSVAFTPDGKRLVSGGEPDVIVLWDLESGRSIRTIAEGSGSAIEAVAISPDGRTVISGGLSHQMILWDLESGKLLRRFIGHTAPINDVSFSRDGRRVLSVGSDKTIRLWDSSTGQSLGVWTGHLGEIYSASFSPDGHMAIVGDSSGAIKLWDLQKESDIPALRGHTARVISLSATADGRIVLSGSFDKSVRLWDVATGQPIRTIAAGESPVWGVALTRDGHTAASVHENGTLALWDVTTGNRLREFRAHQDVATATAFSPDGTTIISASSDGTLKLWKVATGELIRTFIGHLSRVRAVAFSPDGRSVTSAAFDNTLKVWDIASGKVLHNLQGHSHWVQSVAVSSDGQMVASGGWDHRWGLWQFDTGKRLSISAPLADVVTGVAFSPDGKILLTATLDGNVGIWDVAHREHVRDLKRHDDGVTCLQFCADGVTALSGSRDGMIRRWQFDRPARYAEFCTAVPKARDALSHNPNDVEALKVFARWYAFRGIYDWAAEFLEKARSVGGEISHLELARCYWQLGRNDESASEFAKAIDKKEAPADYLSFCRQAVTTQSVATDRP